MHPGRVVVVFEQLQFPPQVICGPKEQTIQILTPEGRDEPLNKGMGSNRRLHPVGRVREDLSKLPILSIRSLVISLTC
jgi:hypothetical protein